MTRDDIYREFSGMSDEEWVEIVVRSASTAKIRGIEFPGLPDPDLQKTIVGSSGEIALNGGSRLYLEIKNYCTALDIGFGEETHILDFGCGFGRHVRFFLKDVPPGGIIGVDVNNKLISICKETIPMGYFSVIEPWPPLDFNSGYFDLVYAYSVFSHLSEKIATAWIKDFSRILKPRGVTIITTHSRRFIDYCEDLRTKPHLDNLREQRLANTAFVDCDQAYRDYVRGNFLYSSSKVEDRKIIGPEIFGQAVISLRYVCNHWLDDFELIDFIDDTSRLPQAMIVLQRKK